ncbi:MAG: hypothetical protein IJ272_04080 [Clostridia bacterium]|nr:hypothetical protein [Clostridia bacterium]
MKRYTKLIILSVVLLVLIALITLAMIFDVDLMLFRNLSIAGIQEKKLAVEVLMQRQTVEESNNTIAKSELQTSKNSFDVAKETYENIDESTIEIVQEATKEEKYFIEYLWIVLGNYATTNNVAINITTPGAGAEGETAGTGVQITIEGRYSNIADFVFDVENDKSLRFKLDNIKMTYSGNNKVKATFDVLSLAVLN